MTQAAKQAPQATRLPEGWIRTPDAYLSIPYSVRRGPHGRRWRALRNAAGTRNPSYLGAFDTAGEAIAACEKDREMRRAAW